MKLACDKIPPNSPEMPTKLLKALVQESHNQNQGICSHRSVDNAMNAIEAGADILHGIWRDPLNSEQAKWWPNRGSRSYIFGILLTWTKSTKQFHHPKGSFTGTLLRSRTGNRGQW